MKIPLPKAWPGLGRSAAACRWPWTVAPRTRARAVLLPRTRSLRRRGEALAPPPANFTPHIAHTQPTKAWGGSRSVLCARCGFRSQKRLRAHACAMPSPPIFRRTAFAGLLACPNLFAHVRAPSALAPRFIDNVRKNDTSTLAHGPPDSHYALVLSKVFEVVIAPPPGWSYFGRLRATLWPHYGPCVASAAGGNSDENGRCSANVGQHRCKHASNLGDSKPMWSFPNHIGPTSTESARYVGRTRETCV